MPKLYAAFTQAGHRQASGSMTTLRKKVMVFPDTQWSIFRYDLKPGVETFVTLLEGDISKLPAPTHLEHWRINAQGQVRKFDPSKSVIA